MSDSRTDASPSGALSGPRAFPEGHLSVQPDGDPKILAQADHALGSMQEPPPPPPPSSPSMPPHAPLHVSHWIDFIIAVFPEEDIEPLMHGIQDCFKLHCLAGDEWYDANHHAENSALLRAKHPHLFWIGDEWNAGRHPDLGNPEFMQKLVSARREAAGAAQHGNRACAALSRGSASGAADGQSCSGSQPMLRSASASVPRDAAWTATA